MFPRRRLAYYSARIAVVGTAFRVDDIHNNNNNNNTVPLCSDWRHGGPIDFRRMKICRRSAIFAVCFFLFRRVRSSAGGFGGLEFKSENLPSPVRRSAVLVKGVIFVLGRINGVYTGGF